MAPKLKFEFDKDHVKSWAEEGKKAGTFAQEVFTATESAVMEMLLAIAAVIAGTPSAEDWLSGYASSWTNKDTGKSRKTDARAVLDAYAMKGSDSKPLPVERTIGYEKNADGSDKLDERKLRIPVKMTLTAPEWLQQYEIGNGEGQGDFKGFLALARELRNRGTDRSSQGSAVSRKTKVTDTQFGNVMEQVPAMTQKQAETMIIGGLQHVAKIPGFEPSLIAEMEYTCNILKTSKNVFYQEAAAEILDVLHAVRSKVAHSEKVSKEALANTNSKTAGQTQGDIQVPQPAAKTGTGG